MSSAGNRAANSSELSLEGYSESMLPEQSSPPQSLRLSVGNLKCRYPHINLIKVCFCYFWFFCSLCSYKCTHFLVLSVLVITQLLAPPFFLLCSIYSFHTLLTLLNTLIFCFCNYKNEIFYTFLKMILWFIAEPSDSPRKSGKISFFLGLIAQPKGHSEETQWLLSLEESVPPCMSVIIE